MRQHQRHPKRKTSMPFQALTIIVVIIIIVVVVTTESIKALVIIWVG